MPPEDRSLTPASRNPPDKPDFSEETVKKFLEVQEKQIAAQLEELAVRKANDKSSSEYAHKVLETQERDRKDDRHHQRKIFGWLMGGIMGAVLIVVTFLGYCVWMGKEALATEVIKSLVLVFGGGFGGYGLGRIKSSSDTDPGK